MALDKLYAAAWEAPALASLSEFTTFCQYLDARGFTGVVLSYMAHIKSFSFQNRNGNPVGTGGFGSNFVLNANYANDVEAMLTVAQANDLEVFIIPSWENEYVGKTNQLNTGNAYQLGYDLDNRFGNHPALKGWAYGGDNHTGNYNEQIWINMRNGMEASAANRGGTVAPVSYHYLASIGGNNGYLGSWMDIAAPETGHCQNANKSENDLTDAVAAKGRPVHAGEMRYEQIDPQWPGCGGQGGPYPVPASSIQDDAQAAANAGCVAYWYSHNEWWQWGEANNGGSGQKGAGVIATTTSSPPGLELVITDHGPFDRTTYGGGGNPGGGTLTQIRINLGGGDQGLFTAGAPYQANAQTAVRTNPISFHPSVTNQSQVPSTIGQSEAYDSTNPSDMEFAVQMDQTKIYNIDMFFCETWFGPGGGFGAGGVGSRVFDVLLNGTEVLSNFDVFSAAGGENTLYQVSLTDVSTDPTGWLRFTFNRGQDNPQMVGLRIVSTTAPAPQSGQVSWFAAHPSHDRWEVQHREGLYGEFTTLATVFEPAYTFQNLDPDVTNMWRVRGGDANGWALWSNETIVVLSDDVSISVDPIVSTTTVAAINPTTDDGPLGQVTVNVDQIENTTVVATITPAFDQQVTVPQVVSSTVINGIVPSTESPGSTLLTSMRTTGARFTKSGRTGAQFI